MREPPVHYGDYPTEEELKFIREWKILGPDDILALLDYVKSIWWNADWGVALHKKRSYFSTGGWSGNEMIIESMEENFMFWSMSWDSSRRGGHYEFTHKERSK